MTSYVRDRWLWLGLGLTLALVSYVAHVVSPDLAQRQDEEKGDTTDQPVSQPPDRLSLRTLRTLIDSPNPNISQMAIDLVHKRMRQLDVNAEVMRSIKVDAQLGDYDLKRKANMALQYLRLDDDIPRVWSPAWSEASSSSPHDETLWREVVPSAAAPIAGWTAIPRERPSASDSDVRRRRREAMVMHEGTGDLNEDDIFRPEHDSI